MHRYLRRKILALLPDMDGRLQLDFAGIESASSSFLDELLGRLVAELGLEGFKAAIQVVNAPESLVSMANVVIEQRLGMDKETLIKVDAECREE